MKKMKKFLSFIFVIAISQNIVACNNSDIPSSTSSYISSSTSSIVSTEQYYKLDVIDEGRWLIYDRDDVYEVGEMIKFHTYVHPINIDMYVDGEFYSSGTRVSLNENDDYIEYKYIMPSKNVTVEFRTDLIKYSHFLMLYPWLGNLQYYETKQLDIEVGKIGVSNDEPLINTFKSPKNISRIIEELWDMDVCMVKKDSPLCDVIEGGEYIKYSFITETETHIIYIENRRLEIDGNIYLIYGEYPIK